jgi:hypothetical protein
MSPDWLAEFQSRFGAVLRAPLDRTSGTLRAVPSSYDMGPDAPSGERLAVYNRQYWFRLFGVFHTAFPLTTRLVGHWSFNDYAARFLLEHPPRGWDIDDVPHGFEDWFAAALGEPSTTVEPEALREAARIDAAWRRVFRAPSTTPFHPSSKDATGLLDSRLELSPAVALVSERWPLLELKRALSGDDGEAPVALPAALPEPRFWALVRRAGGIGQMPLEAREAELFDLLARHTVRDALVRLEAACPEAERATLPENAQRWLARSVQLDFWTRAHLQRTQL